MYCGTVKGSDRGCRLPRLTKPREKLPRGCDIIAMADNTSLDPSRPDPSPAGSAPSSSGGARGPSGPSSSAAGVVASFGLDHPSEGERVQPHSASSSGASMVKRADHGWVEPLPRARGGVQGKTADRGVWAHTEERDSMGGTEAIEGELLILSIV